MLTREDDIDVHALRRQGGRSPRSPGSWGETLGDDDVAAATIDGLVHHAHVIVMGGTQSCN